LKITESGLKLTNVLNALDKNGKQKREFLAESIGASAQRINGFIDNIEELGLVKLDRSFKPYQVELTDIGRKFFSLLKIHKADEIIKTAIDNLQGS
jgi:hypothetical protein